MDRNQFATAVANPTAFSSHDRAWLRAMMDKYPHSSVVAVLALLADHAHHFDTPEQRRTVALSMCDSRGLSSLLASVSPKTNDDSFDILNEINTYQEVSFKTAPKSVILSNFLQTDSNSSSSSTPNQASIPNHDEKKSIRVNNSLATETLAVILEKQGKLSQAIEVYQKLLASNPEKISIFAPRIEKLKETLNSK